MLALARDLAICWCYLPTQVRRTFLAMRDAITGLIGRYDQLGRYLDRDAIERISGYLNESALRLAAVELINGEAAEIVREASQRLWQADPELLLPGGNAYTTRRWAACLRELQEETNVTSVSLLAEASDWHAYDLPGDVANKAWRGRYHGQRQKWFALRFEGDESEIDIHSPGGGAHKPEFDAWRWNDYWVPLDVVVEFKRGVYEMALTGEPIDAQEALELGLLNYVVPAAELDAKVEWLLARLMDKSPTAIRKGKYAMRISEQLNFDQSAVFMEGQIGTLALTEDAAEGRAAFIEKRLPNWPGR